MNLGSVRARAFGRLRVPLPGRQLPEPETTARRWAIRGVALLATGASGLYLAWRVTSTVDPSVWWVSLPFVVLEIHAAVGIALLTFSLWDIDRRPPTRRVWGTDARIAVLIPTHDEGVGVLMATIAAAVAMHLDHETWVVDDGARPEVDELARDLGARYLARDDRRHGTAGSLNHALAVVDADFYAVLDADHVAAPRFLAETLGYFDDPRVAVVQTPHAFYNVDSFEHAGGDADGGGDRFHEQALFHRVLQAGKNRWGAALWCGTGAVIRVSALRAIGGIATGTVAEDLHTTIRLHRAGWTTVHHNEVLARGLAANDAATYQARRLRWGTGAMQVLRTENPVLVRGLRPGQRLAYAATLFGWFDSWRTLGYLLLPAAILVTGSMPVRADPVTFIVAFGVTFGLQQAALGALSRGCHRPLLSVMFDLVRMTPDLLATLTLATGRRFAFGATSKDGIVDEPRAARAPRLLLAIVAVDLLAAAWFGLTLLGLTPIRYPAVGAALGALAWLVAGALLVLAATRRVRALRYAPERRASVRFEADVPAVIESAEAVIRDISLTGIRVDVANGTVGRRSLVVIEIGSQTVELVTVIRSRRPTSPGREQVGLEFEPGQHVELARLALAVFGTRLVPGPDAVVRLPAFRRPRIVPAA